MNTADLHALRSGKDQFFKTDHHSPIEDQQTFSGLQYFPPAPEWVFTVTPQASDRAWVTVQTSDGAERQYRRSAFVEFETPDGQVELTLYSTDGSHEFFVPFRDATAGEETYGAGRYLDIEPNADGTVTIDFNLAYNPYCAYSDAYSCPLPPPGNWLNVAIRAGERSPI